MPPLIVSNGVLNEPLLSAGAMKPCEMTVKTITIMPTRANVLAFASCDNPISIMSTRTPPPFQRFLTLAISRYSVKG
jgi:hypothetical protein